MSFPGFRGSPAGRVVLRLKPPQRREPGPAAHPMGAWLGPACTQGGSSGLSTGRARCSGGPRQRPSLAPPLQPSPSTWLLSRLYAWAVPGVPLSRALHRGPSSTPAPFACLLTGRRQTRSMQKCGAAAPLSLLAASSPSSVPPPSRRATSSPPLAPASPLPEGASHPISSGAAQE